MIPAGPIERLRADCHAAVLSRLLRRRERTALYQRKAVAALRRADQWAAREANAEGKRWQDRAWHYHQAALAYAAAWTILEETGDEYRILLLRVWARTCMRAARELETSP